MTRHYYYRSGYEGPDFALRTRANGSIPPGARSYSSLGNTAGTPPGPLPGPLGTTYAAPGAQRKMAPAFRAYSAAFALFWGYATYELHKKKSRWKYFTGLGALLSTANVVTGSNVVGEVAKGVKQ